MAYSDFTLARLKKKFKLLVEEQSDLFAGVEPIPPSDFLALTLAETVDLALAINTEKARSELIIAPLLLELKRRSNGCISLFSGTDFNVAPEQGLNGFCDFILSRSREQLTINAPVAIVLQAKNEDIKGGLGQCGAAMLAAQLFNQEKGNEAKTIYGAVTTGDIWKFLKLAGDRLFIDLSNFYIKDVDKILGCLLEAIGEQSV